MSSEGNLSKTQSRSSNLKGPLNSTRRRTTKIGEKKIADDEFMAASIGDVEWLKQSIKDKKDNLNCDKNGLTPLHLAAIHGRLDCLKLLIEHHQIDVNLASGTGWRPLHLVISNQTGKRALQCLVYLLEKGADPSLKNEDGISPCHQAASEGHVHCLKLLLETGTNVDCKDYRGHTPLDLAKLWGHRKCARILAAELWQQEKEHVAKEMKQLKKVKMQQVLQEMEAEEEFKATQEFYGDMAFQEWLDRSKIHQKPPGHPGKDVQDKAVKQSNTLHKPNSVAAKGGPTAPRKVSQLDPTALSQTTTLTATPKEETPQGKRSMATHRSEDSTKDRSCQPVEMSRRVQPHSEEQPLPVYTNAKGWNKSTKPSKTEYTVNLKDDYPRDEYTMMPTTEEAPKFYDGSFWRKVETPQLGDAENFTKKRLRNPDLPRETVRRFLSRDHTKDQRPFIFKAKHIHDVHSKKKYEKEERPRSEASLHLCNDVSSVLFQKSLQDYVLTRRQKKTTSSRSSRSRESPESDWSKSDYPRMKVVTMLETMSEPKRFPPIQGEEYELHLVK